MAGSFRIPTVPTNSVPRVSLRDYMLHTATRFSRSSDSVFCVMQSGISLLDNGRLKPRHYREGNMSLRQVLFSTVGAIGLAAMAGAGPAPAGAQQAAVQIDNHDIGGGVTRGH